MATLGVLFAFLLQARTAALSQPEAHYQVSASSASFATRSSSAFFALSASFATRSKTSAELLELDPRLPHHLPPLGGVLADVLPQLLGRARARLGALRGEAFLERGRGQRFHECGVETLHEVLRRGGRDEDADHRAGIEARHGGL